MKKKERYCLITNDVETTSILHHKLSKSTGKLVLKEGIPALLELYSKYNIKSTFFFTGYFAENFPEAVKMVIPYGHEVGSHGYTHEIDKAFDILPLTEQIIHLNKSKKILEDITGKEVISFRAPAARVNKNTAIALKETGFKIDSSISSQRFDMFFSFGSIKKFNGIIAPRLPYFTSPNSLWKRGNGPIFEIPISAFFLPYIGTTMRIFPTLNKILRKLLHFETSINGKPIVFLTHPNEYIDEEISRNKLNRRNDNFLSYLFRDVIRHKLKIKNLGKIALPLYENEINYFRNKNYEFITCNSYYKIINNLSTK